MYVHWRLFNPCRTTCCERLGRVYLTLSTHRTPLRPQILWRMECLDLPVSTHLSFVEGETNAQRIPVRRFDLILIELCDFPSTSMTSSHIITVEYLGFNNKTCDDGAPPRSDAYGNTVGPILRETSAESNQWRWWNVTVTTDSNGSPFGVIKTTFPSGQGMHRCVGYYMTDYYRYRNKKACRELPWAARVHLHKASHPWRLVHVPNTDCFNIIDEGKPKTCFRYLSASSACSERYMHLTAADDGTGLQRWRIKSHPFAPHTKSPSPLPNSPSPMATISIAIGCEDRILELNCPSGQVIDLLSMHYGRQSTKTCPQVLDGWPGGNDNVECLDSPSLDASWRAFVSNRCNGRQSCGIFVSYWISGCAPFCGISKYSEAQYRCVVPAAGLPALPSCLPKHENCEVEFSDTGRPLPCCDNMACELGHCITCKSRGETCTENLECCGVNDLCIGRVCTAGAKNQTGTLNSVPPGSQFARACEFNYLDLYCPAGKVINIVSAAYGRDSFKLCTHGHEAWSIEPIYDDRLCRNSYTDARWLAHMSARCNNRRGCTALVSNNVAGDPCGATYKYAEVVYTCEVPLSANDALPFCLPAREDCKRQFGPLGVPGPCCRQVTSFFLLW